MGSATGTLDQEIWGDPDIGCYRGACGQMVVVVDMDGRADNGQKTDGRLMRDGDGDGAGPSLSLWVKPLVFNVICFVDALDGVKFNVAVDEPTSSCA